MITDKNNPPTNDKGRWERGLDPWHKDAFPDEHQHAAPRQTGLRKEGWFELDGFGNPIAFIPDGEDV